MHGRHVWIGFAVAIFVTSDTGGLCDVEQLGRACCAEVTNSAPATTAENRPNLPLAVKRILTRSNRYRFEHKRVALRTEPVLTQVATYFANFMASHEKYGHDADSRQPEQRAALFKYDYCLVRENIAYRFDPKGFTTDELLDEFMSGWKKSPMHRKNLLDADLKETGIAIARGAKTGRYYAVMMFGRPASAAITFKITNQAAVEVQYVVAGQSFSLKPRYTRTHRQHCRPPVASFPVPAAGAGVANRETMAYSMQHGKHYAIVNKGSGLIFQLKATVNAPVHAPAKTTVKD